MKTPKEGNRRTRPQKAVDPIFNRVHSRPRHSVERRHSDLTECEENVRAALSRHLHDLMNALWPAAARIELAISEQTYPPKFCETLEQVRRSVEEAMTIASQASALLDLPASERSHT